jgi:DNA replication protein DnaC
MAFLDRLVEGAVIIKIKGDSYRARNVRAGKSAPQKPEK